MSYSTRTLVLIGFGVTLVAGLSYVSFREDPVPVDLAIVMRGPLEVTINADGQSQVAKRNCIFAGAKHATPVHGRDALSEGAGVEGPAIIEEPSTATIVPPGWKVRAAQLGCLILERTA